MEAIKGSPFFGGSKAKRAGKKKVSTSSTQQDSQPHTKSSQAKLTFDLKRASKLATGAKKTRSFIDQLSPDSRAKQLGQLDALAAASVSGSDSYRAENGTNKPQRAISGKSLGTGEINSEDLIIKAVSSKLSVASVTADMARNRIPTHPPMQASSSKQLKKCRASSQTNGHTSNGSRTELIYPSNSADGSLYSEHSMYKTTIDSKSSSWDKSNYKGSTLGSVFCQDGGIVGLQDNSRRPVPEHSSDADDDESYDVISTGNSDRGPNGIAYNYSPDVSRNGDDESSSSSESEEEEEEEEEDDDDDDDDEDEDEDDDDDQGESSGSRSRGDSTDSGSAGGGDDGSESNEDYSNDEDEGEDGYKPGGYHRVKIAEVYNQR